MMWKEERQSLIDATKEDQPCLIYSMASFSSTLILPLIRNVYVLSAAQASPSRGLGGTVQ